jgi:hypothetical protein
MASEETLPPRAPQERHRRAAFSDTAIPARFGHPHRDFASRCCVSNSATIGILSKDFWRNRALYCVISMKMIVFIQLINLHPVDYGRPYIFLFVFYQSIGGRKIGETIY